MYTLFILHILSRKKSLICNVHFPFLQAWLDQTKDFDEVKESH